MAAPTLFLSSASYPSVTPRGSRILGIQEVRHSLARSRGSARDRPQEALTAAGHTFHSSGWAVSRGASRRVIRHHVVVVDLLYVCEGNVCRSPYAHYVTAFAVRELADPPMISSAGTKPREGASIEAEEDTMLRDLGIDASRHAARRLRSADIMEAELVLTATRAQRTHVVRKVPQAVQRTFTIRQVASILSGAPISFDDLVPDATLGGRDRVARLAELLRYYRIGGGPPELDDVVDPHHKRSSKHLQAVREMAPAISMVIHVLGGERQVLPERAGR
ncbi:MAG: hypothetical protein QM655_07100 [Nocardioidaceae bacterium]